VDSDQGREWLDVETFLKEQGVGYTVKESTNSLAVLDSAIGSFKQAISRLQLSKNSESWVDQVVPATSAHNRTPAGALRGDEPREIDKPLVRFHALQDNATKIQQNQKSTENRKAQLETSGYFRPLLPRSAWERANRPKYAGTTLKVDNIQGTSVKATNGKLFPLSSVTAVRESSKDIKVPKALQIGSRARDERIATALAPFATQLKNFMGSGVQTIPPASKYMKSTDGWEEAMTKLRLNRPGGFATAARALGIVVSGSGQAMRIRAPGPVVKRRIVGKTKQ
jgi:hypothetical protein